MVETPVQQWCDKEGQGPALTRAAIARWIASNPGRGVIWQDQGKSGRLLCDPLQSWMGQDFELLQHLPLPAKVPGQEQWAGWLSYDLAARQVAPLQPRFSGMPDLGLRRYSGALHLYADGSYARVGSTPWCDDLFEQVRAQQEQELSALRWAYGSLENLWSQARYAQAFEQIGRHLVQGDTYQINLSHPMRAAACEQLQGAKALAQAVHSFAVLAQTSPAPHGAFVDVDGTRAILCNSPELLFSVLPDDEGWRIWTGPIKGTRPRGKTAQEDAQLAKALLASPKDAAEHLMIVDLLRNDLGRIAEPGSVEAPALPSLLSLPTVHHLESKIHARLQPDLCMLDLWRALAPGGSVTGAPKRRSLEIIDALEREARGLYCGSIFVGDAQALVANIAIRTAHALQGELRLRSGGGIVLDSELEDEWLETLDKARAYAAPPCDPGPA